MTYGSSIFTSWFQIICEVNEVNLSLSYGGVIPSLYKRLSPWGQTRKSLPFYIEHLQYICI